jgi:DNA invertase Pin-like site-specific DNA recombinase
VLQFSLSLRKGLRKQLARLADDADMTMRAFVLDALKDRGVKLHLLDLGGDIAGNGISKLFLTIAAAFAEAERDRIRERIGQVKADQKARRAVPWRGRPVRLPTRSRRRAGAA